MGGLCSVLRVGMGLGSHLGGAWDCTGTAVPAGEMWEFLLEKFILVHGMAPDSRLELQRLNFGGGRAGALM